MMTNRLFSWLLLSLLAMAVEIPSARAEKVTVEAGSAHDLLQPAYRDEAGEPPAAVAARDMPSARSAALSVERNGYKSVQVNVDGDGMNIVGDAANEPSIAVNPLDPANMVIIWRQFDSVDSSHRQNGFGYTFDAGASWTFPGSIVPDVYYSDPFVRANPKGEFLYMGHTYKTFPRGRTLATDLFRSADGGVTWSQPIDAFGGDKHTLAIDRTGGIGHGASYWYAAGAQPRYCSLYPAGSVVDQTLTCENGEKVMFLRRRPGEVCFYWPDGNQDACCGLEYFWRGPSGGPPSEPGVPFHDPDLLVPITEHYPSYPLLGSVEVGNDGEVYVAGSTLVAPLVPGPEEETFCAAVRYEARQIVYRSESARDPSLTPTFEKLSMPLLGGIHSQPGLKPNPGGATGDVVIKVDRSDGVRRGYLYLLSTVNPDPLNVPAGTDPRDVFFSHSEDGGLTWTPRKRINDDAEGNGAWQWFGTMSVAPNGRIDAIWNDTRNSDGDVRLSELFYSYSNDGGDNWSPNVPVSPQWNSHLGWPNQNKIGDYYDMESDLYGTNVAYAATFGGEQNVFYLRLFPDCNANGQSDVLDIETLVSSDVDGDAQPDECSGLVLLNIPNPSSDVIRFEVGGATPGAKVSLLFSEERGSDVVAACPKQPTGLSAPVELASGIAPVRVPDGLSSPVQIKAEPPKTRERGEILVQAVDQGSCRMSAVLAVPLPARG